MKIKKPANLEKWLRCSWQPSHGRFVLWKNVKRGYIESFSPSVDPNTIDMHLLLGGNV